jgi:hypothetical protein
MSSTAGGGGGAGGGEGFLAGAAGFLVVAFDFGFEFCAAGFFAALAEFCSTAAAPEAMAGMHRKAHAAASSGARRSEASMAGDSTRGRVSSHHTN